ncbi:hypothetical protein H6770_03945 [Candidatus Peribacteria bacterium]|nr:hypothetical protein [Candidatus Peribacteria bacterium]
MVPDPSAPATKEDIWRIEHHMVTKKDIEGFTTEKDLERFATKNDLERFATKKDLERFATKKDLERFATKKDLERFATKKDLEKFATKGDFGEIMRRLDILSEENTLIINNLSSNINRLDAMLAKHDQRITVLETASLH